MHPDFFYTLNRNWTDTLTALKVWYWFCFIRSEINKTKLILLRYEQRDY